MREQIKKKLIFVLKYFVGLALLVWILLQIDRKQMLLALATIPMDVVLPIILIALLNILGQFLRWKFLVEKHSNHYQKNDLLPSFFAGFAFRMMVPGGHAEITKVFLLPGQKRGKIVAFGIEKFFQTYIKFVFVVLALPLVFPQYRIFSWTIAGVAIAAYFFLPVIFRLSYLKQLQEKEINYNLIFVRTLLYSLAIFACLIVQYYILLNEFHSIGLGDSILAVIFIWGSGLLPITVSGLGVRENIAVFFLTRHEIPAYAAVAASLFIFFINLVIPALIGLFFIYKRRKDLNDAPAALRMATKTIYESGIQRINGKYRKFNKKPDPEITTDNF